MKLFSLIAMMFYLSVLILPSAGHSAINSWVDVRESQIAQSTLTTLAPSNHKAVLTTDNTSDADLDSIIFQLALPVVFSFRAYSHYKTFDKAERNSPYSSRAPPIHLV